MERAGLLIVIEGVDGVGKSTLLPLLAQRLESLAPVRRLREPGGTPRAEELRATILDGTVRNGPEALELFSLARESLVNEVVRPALDRGEVVLLDRFILTTRVYQGEQGVEDAVIMERTGQAVGDVEADATIILTISEEELVRRRSAREKAGKVQRDQFDQGGLRKLLQRQARYLALAAEDPRALPIDAEGTVEEIVERAMEGLARVGVLDRLAGRHLLCIDETSLENGAPGRIAGR